MCHGALHCHSFGGIIFVIFVSCLVGLLPIRVNGVGGILSRESKTADDTIHYNLDMSDSFIRYPPLNFAPDANMEERRLDASDFQWERFGMLTGAVVLIFAVGILGVELPKILQYLGKKDGSWVSRHAPVVETLCNSFAAGAFWGLALLHVSVDAIDTLYINQFGIIINGISFYNAAFLLIFAGYLILFIAEHFLIVFSNRYALKAEKKMKEEVGDETDVARSLEIEKRLRKQIAFTECACATIGLSIHSFFEGMVIGMRESDISIAIAALSVAGHKWAAAFALSQSLAIAGVTTAWSWILLGTFLLATPVGIYVGFPLGSSGNVVMVAIFNALSAGILIYVANDMTHDIFRVTDWSKAIDKAKAEKARLGIQDMQNSRVSLVSKAEYAEISNRTSQAQLTNLNVDDSVSTSSGDNSYDSDKIEIIDELETGNGVIDSNIPVPDKASSGLYFAEDPFKSSYSVLTWRMCFLLFGAGIMFAMMCLDLTNSDSGHPIPCDPTTA